MKRKGLILARLSKGGKDKESTEDQIEQLEHFFATEGIDYDLDESLIDDGVSSYDADRATYVGVKKALEERRYQVIGLTRVDRLSRDVQEYVNELIPLMWESKSVVRLANGMTFDCSTEEGQEAFLQEGFVAQRERTIIGVRTRAAHRRRARAGRPSCQAPFGYEAYDDDDGKRNWRIVDAEAELICDAVARVLKGGTVDGILREWSAAGVTTGRGNAWKSQTFRRLLTRESLAGIRRHGIYERSPKNKEKKTLKGVEFQPATWPAIITEAQHHALLALFDGRKTRVQHAMWKLIPSPLTRCGVCGARLEGAPRPGGRHCYRCSQKAGGCGRISIMADHFERWVIEQLVSTLNHPSSDILPSGVSGREEALEQELAAKLATVKLIEDDFLFGGHRLVEAANYPNAHDRAVAERDQVKRELMGLRRSDSRGHQIRQWRAEGFDLNAWNALPFERKRQMLTAMIRRITLLPDIRDYRRFDDPGVYERVMERRVEIEWAEAAQS